MPVHYRWNRLWEPVVTSHLRMTAGPIGEPKDEAVSFGSISGVPCLVLVGEPGIGKSTTVEDIVEAARNSGAEARRVDLLLVQNSTDLDTYIFQRQWFQRWLEGNQRLYLFLDGLDECQMRPGSRAAAKAIVERLLDVPKDRLLLRLVCKAAEVPGNLLEELQRLWREDSEIQVYRLGLLSREDIAFAASENGLDPEAFLTAVDNRRVLPLAQVPMLLQMIIASYVANGTIPPDRSSLYEMACSTLVSKPDHEDVLGPDLDRSQRLAVARRMAAMSSLTGSRLFLLADDSWQNHVDLAISDCIGGHEAADENRFPVTESGVRLTLRTPLFSAGSREQMQWIHGSYASFLAARYFLEHETTSGQLHDILFHPAGRLILHLRETALWLAQRRRDVLDALIDLDPEALLDLSDELLPEETKPRVVASMLRLAEDGNPSEVNPFAVRGIYRHLRHAGLAQQLSPYIEEPSTNPEVRWLALEIARDCGLPELADVLANLALDTTQPVAQRRIAARAAVESGDSATLRKLEPLALNPQYDSEGDELKGTVLGALWPDHITLTQLFEALTVREERLHFGSYWAFIERLPASLDLDTPEAADIALLWAQRLETTQSRVTREFRTLVQHIVSSSLAHLPSCGAQLARLLGASPLGLSISWSTPELVERLRANPEERRLLMTLWMEYSRNTGYDVDTGVLGGRFLLAEDIPWLIERLMEAPAEDQDYLARVIQIGLWHPDAERWIPVALQAAQNCPPLSRALTPEFGSNPEAPDLHLWRIRLGLDITEDANDEYEGVDRVPENVPSSGLTGLLDPWQTNLPSLGQGIVESIDPDRLEVFRRSILSWGQDSRSELAFTGEAPILAIAFYVVRELDQEFFRSLPPETALHLSRQVLEVVAYHNLLPADYARCLTETLFDFSKPQFVQALREEVAEQNRSHGCCPVLNRVEDVCPRAVVEGLAEDAYCDQALRRESLAVLFAIQLRHGSDEVTDRVYGLLEGIRAADEKARLRASVAIECLLLHSRTIRWAELRKAITTAPELGREAMLKVAYNWTSRSSTNFLLSLSEGELSGLYRWLMDNFPAQQYPPPGEGFRTVGPEDEIATLRDERVLSALAAKGTLQAVDQLGDLLRSFPDAPRLAGMRRLGIRQARQQGQLMVPKQFLRWIGKRDARFIVSHEHLLEVIQESLARLEAEFRRQETPMAIAVWNEHKQSQEEGEAAEADYSAKKKGKKARGDTT